jgi:CRP-like cAMP-binding protein
MASFQSSMVLKNLVSARLREMSPFLQDVHLVEGEVLYDAGEAVDAVYFPEDAVLSVVTVMRDGQMIETATVGNESIVGVIAALAEGRTHARTFVQVAGRATRLPASRLRQLVRESPGLLKLLLAYVQRDIAQAEQSVACNALPGVTQRFARWLLLFQDRVESPIVVLTQEHIARVLGVQRTTVTLAAQKLRDLGAISYRRGRIEIVDRQVLERASCECYAASQIMEPDPQVPAHAAD